MQIAIISDSHDNIASIDHAVSALFELNPQLVIHCGDISSPSTLERFQGLPVRFVFGNCDWDEPLLQSEARALGFKPIEHTLELSLEEKKIFVCHGDRANIFKHALASQEFDYIFHGHTHLACDLREGKTRVVNPGALYRAAEYSFAVLQLDTDQLTFIDVPKEPQ